MNDIELKYNLLSTEQKSKVDKYIQTLLEEKNLSPCVRKKCSDPASCCGCPEYFKWKNNKENI